jgi:hypothetical protein
MEGLVDKALGQIMRFERWLMRAGVRFGFGGSLLVVAEKKEKKSAFDVESAISIGQQV